MLCIHEIESIGGGTRHDTGDFLGQCKSHNDISGVDGGGCYQVKLFEHTFQHVIRD